MSGPKRKEPHDPEFVIDDELHTQVTFPDRNDIPGILSFLRREKQTGTLMLDLNVGGVNRVRFVQRQSVDVI